MEQKNARWNLAKFAASFLLALVAGRIWRALPPACDITERDDVTRRDAILVGVLTSRHTVTSRAVAVWRTWARTIPGRVVFFASEGASLPGHPEIPVIPLPGVDDRHPPMKKSFLMLKYMHERWGGDYEWFVQVDDDVYINTQRLVTFLKSLNSTRALCFADLEQDETVEHSVSVNVDENRARGSQCVVPAAELRGLHIERHGIVMAHETLRRVAPGVSDCLRHLVTDQVGVEVGRCVHRHAGVRCGWNHTLQHIFYDAGSQDNFAGTSSHGRGDTFYENKSDIDRCHTSSGVIADRIQREHYKRERVHQALEQLRESLKREHVLL